MEANVPLNEQNKPTDDPIIEHEKASAEVLQESEILINIIFIIVFPMRVFVIKFA